MAIDRQIPVFNQANRKAITNSIVEMLSADKSALAVYSKVAGDFNKLVGMFDVLDTSADTLFESVARTEADGRLSVVGQAENLATARNNFLQHIDGLQASADRSFAAIHAVIDPLINPSAVDASTPAGTLVDIEKTRDAWRRVVMVLDSIDNVGLAYAKALEMAKTASERNDAYTQTALRDDLESYLEARGLKVVGLPDMINRAMAPASTPAQRAAMVIQETLRQGWQNLVYAFGVVRGYGSGQTPFRVDGLPGFPPVPPIQF